MGFFSDIKDSIFGDDPSDVFKKQRGHLDVARGELAGGFNQARGQIGAGIEAEKAGIESAERKASGISRGARREAKDRASQMQGLATLRYGAGGKYGTTALDQARLGIQSSLTRDLESIDSAMAGLFSELAGEKGRVEGQGRFALANIGQQEGRAQAGLSTQLAGLVPQQEGIFGDLVGAATGIGLSTLI